MVDRNSNWIGIMQECKATRHDIDEAVAGSDPMFIAALEFRAGYNYGFHLGGRNWTKPASWHRGYMRGRLERIRIDRMDNRDADPDPHQIDIGGEG